MVYIPKMGVEHTLKRRARATPDEIILTFNREDILNASDFNLNKVANEKWERMMRVKHEKCRYQIIRAVGEEYNLDGMARITYRIYHLEGFQKACLGL